MLKQFPSMLILFDRDIILKKIERNNKCLLCGSTCFQFKVINDRYNVFKCTECSLEFVDPMPSSRELNEFYSGYSNFRAEDAVVKKNSLRNIRYLNKFGLSKKKKLLDFGCGKNIFITEESSNNWFGFDKYSNINRGNLIKEYKSRSWAFITLWGVLEHLVDPKKTLKELMINLESQGKIALTTITTESEIPIRYKPPEHVTFWNKKSIELLFKQVGLKVIDYRDYIMIQRSDVYLDCVLRTVPDEYKINIINKLPEYVEVPTNEIIVIGEKA